MSTAKNKNLMEYITGLERVERFYEENGIDTSLFPLLRLKNCYNTLTDRAVIRNNREAAALFYREIDAIARHPMFGKLPLRYKLFVWGNQCLKNITPVTAAGR